jgi:cell division protein FtsB
MFDNFWGSPASMELNAKQTAIANHATRRAHQWSEYAQELQADNASLQAEIAALKKQNASLQADVRMMKGALLTISGRERAYA